jgi:opacity protein-like surface antigen
MKTTTLFATMLACALLMATSTARAQHATAPNGYYPLGYTGDTWSGQVSAVDPGKREITLTATTKKGAESFVAYVPGHFSIQKNGKGYEVQMSDFVVGQGLRVYYMPKTAKVEGQKVKRNEIIKIESVLAAKGS